MQAPARRSLGAVRSTVGTGDRKSLGSSYSLKKKSTQAPRRMSFAPSKSTTGRPSFAGNGSSSSSGMSSGASRQSLGASRKVSLGRKKSLKKNSLGRMSIKAGTLSKVHDPRPIGEKSYQQKNKRALINYLVNNKYDYPISPKILTAPNGKDFKRIITFLFTKIDPNFQFGKDFEDEVKIYLKTLGYPFAISKASLHAVGSPHTWPSLLAALVWLIELLTYNEEVEAAESEKLDETNDNAVVCEKMFFAYTCEAYEKFLAGQDDFEALEAQLADNFSDKNSSIQEQIDHFEQANNNLQTEIQSLKASQSTVLALQSKRANFLTDNQKFSECIGVLETHKKTIEQKLEERQYELRKQKEEIEAIKSTKGELDEALAVQIYTPAQVTHMQEERRLLEDGLTEFTGQKDSLQKKSWELEREIQRLTDEIEKKVRVFNTTGEELQIIPSTAKYADGREFRVVFNKEGTTVADMVNVDFKGEVKPYLNELKQTLATASRTAQDKVRQAKLAYDTIVETHKEKLEDMAQQEERLKKIDANYAQQRTEMNTELSASVAQVEAMELEVMRLKTNTVNYAQSSEKNLGRVEEEYKQTAAALSKEREQLNQTICAILDELTSHKVKVSEQLSGLNTRVHDVANKVANNIQSFGAKDSTSKTPGSVARSASRSFIQTGGDATSSATFSLSKSRPFASMYGNNTPIASMLGTPSMALPSSFSRYSNTFSVTQAASATPLSSGVKIC